MKVLSILQPWATLAVIGAKKIETRSWNTKYRGPILIHASQRKIKLSDGMYDLISEMEKIPGFMDNYKNLPYGAIIGKADIIDTIGFNEKFQMETSKNLSNQELAFGDYSPGRYGWLLADPVDFNNHHYPVKGSLGLWNFDEEICLRCGCTGEDACAQLSQLF